MTKSEMTISKLKVLGCKIREMYDGLYKYKGDNHIGLIDTKHDNVFPDIWDKISSSKGLVYLYGEDNEALYINGNLYKLNELNSRFGIVHISKNTFTNQNCDYLHIIESNSNRCTLYNRKLDRILILKNLPDCGSRYDIELNVYKERIKNGETEKSIDVYVNNFNDIIEYAKSINSIKELYQMIIFDYLSLNTDRHLGNIGVLVNSDTFKPIKLAPIYDNGASMLNYYMVGDSLEDFVARNIPNLYNSFSILAIKAKEKAGNSNIEKALNIKFNRKKVKGYSDDKIDIIEKFVTNRVSEFLTW